MKIVIEHTTNWSARLIQFWMGVDALLHFKKPRFTYNHAMVKFNTIVYEAVSNGVHPISWENHLKAHKPTQYKEYTVDLSTEEEVIIRNYLYSQQDVPYEFSNFFWHVIKTFTGKWYGSKNDKKEWCYELVTNSLNKIERLRVEDTYPNPREAELIFDEMFKYFEVIDMTVDYTQTDKQLHYNVGRKYGEKLGWFGYMGIRFIGAPLKEVWDFLRNTWYLIKWCVGATGWKDFKFPHSVEYADMVAGSTGAYEGWKGITNTHF